MFEPKTLDVKIDGMDLKLEAIDFIDVAEQAEIEVVNFWIPQKKYEYIYFLTEGLKTVYIGTSKNPLYRTGQHYHKRNKRLGMTFNNVYIFPCPRKVDAYELERALIRVYKPVGNHKSTFEAPTEQDIKLLEKFLNEGDNLE